MTKQLDVILALKALVTGALPSAQVLGFGGTTSFPEVVPVGGQAIGFPGDPGDPEVDLSPPAYTYSHRVQLQVSAGPGATPVDLDDMIKAIGDAVAADPFLGGLCCSLTSTAPVRMDRTQDEATLHWAEFDLVPEYTCDNPLG